LADHIAAETQDSYKVTHLLFNNVGSHGRGKEGEGLFRKRLSGLTTAIDEIGLPMIVVNSNLDDFYGGNCGFQHTHTLRNTCVAHFLSGGIGSYMYASAYSYDDIYLTNVDSMGHCDPVILPLLSTRVLDAFSVGSEYTRVQKTLRIATLPDSYDNLDVCVNPENNTAFTNCSTCIKCIRTLITLDISGNLEKYSKSFDIELYKKNRLFSFAALLNSTNTFNKEIIDFANEKGFQFPKLSQLFGSKYIYPMAKKVRNKLAKHF
jgi:hypothetical protein